MEKVKTTQNAAAKPASELLTDPQAAAYIGGIEPRTLRLWRNTRGLPFLRITPRVIRYRRSDLDLWLDRSRVAMIARPGAPASPGARQSCKGGSQ